MNYAGEGTPHLGTGRCHMHSTEVLNDISTKKKKFIEKYSDQPMTARAAAEYAGVSYMQICRWRKSDPSFDAEVAALTSVADQARAQFIEDSATLRAMDPSNNADTLRIFMLKNLLRGKYRDDFTQEISGPNGGPIQSVQHNVRWDLGDGMKVSFFGATPPRDEPPLPPALDNEEPAQ